MRFAFALLGILCAFSAQAGRCVAHSGPNRAALVELYTSAGCSSCPPADRWLSGLARDHAPERVVPLALHVDYWDYIGWTDPYPKRDFSLRQRKLTRLQRMALVYTPQVMLQGRDFRGWSTSAFDQAVARINARPAGAQLSLEIESLKADAMQVRVAAELADARQKDDAALYLAAYENRLASRVTTAENRGRTLEHDYVVLEWQGPFAFSGAALSEQRRLPLLPRADPGKSGVVGFVQDRRTFEVLQAVMLAACS
jgi:hypothetical protein